ncbi:MAG: hypothetical protein P8N02_15385 [Actinomycetota bacterium]|nr:hypothetical protein [Actinomycetota bacterium]
MTTIAVVGVGVVALGGTVVVVIDSAPAVEAVVAELPHDAATSAHAMTAIPVRKPMVGLSAAAVAA